MKLLAVWSINNCSNNLIYRKIWYRWWRYLSKFQKSFLSFSYHISYHFSEILTEAALGRNICKCLYWNLRKKWWNDESAHSSKLLKLESTTDIFIDQVHKFHNSDFKEYPWKVTAVLQKSMYFKNMLWNTECSNLCFQFPKYRTIRCIKLSFNTSNCTILWKLAYAQGGKWKKLLIYWNEYQEKNTTIGFKFLSPILSRESCFYTLLDYIKALYETSNW